MIGRIEDGECARCDIGEHKCMDCKCGSGADCVPKKDCMEKCQHGGGYKCDWHGKEPVCVKDEHGHLNQTECTAECHDAAYGKCDYVQDECTACKPGQDDRDCVYLMSYCKVAQREGRCKEEVLNGLWRSIEANTGWDHGEFDIEFRGGKMFI